MNLCVGLLVYNLVTIDLKNGDVRATANMCNWNKPTVKAATILIGRVLDTTLANL